MGALALKSSVGAENSEIIGFREIYRSAGRKLATSSTHVDGATV